VWELSSSVSGILSNVSDSCFRDGGVPKESNAGEKHDKKKAQHDKRENHHHVLKFHHHVLKNPHDE
jgi:hypothetical protein